MRVRTLHRHAPDEDGGRHRCSALPALPRSLEHRTGKRASKEDEMADTQVSGMTTHGNGQAGAAPPTPESRLDTQGGGWLTFAGVMFLIAAIFNTVYGISALANDDYFAVDELLFGDLSLWGALYLTVAAAQAVTAVLVFARSSFGAFLGILIAMLSATLALVSIGAYPLWSITIMFVDGLIIYGLSVYGFGEK
jgi:hypothetical protein